MYSVHLPFSMQQSESFLSTRNYHTTQKNQDNSFNFRFQNRERSIIEKTVLDNMGVTSSFPSLIFF
jgi:hypothetical protein